MIMITELRRSKRYNDFLAVSVVAQNGLSREQEAGPYAGRIINISRHGACVLLSLAMLETYKVYSSTWKNDSSFLEVQGCLPDSIGNFRLNGRPIWMEPVLIDEIRAFKMGVEFLTNPYGDQMDDIMETVCQE